MDIHVECYAGFKADERPLRFRVGDEVHFVEEVIERWRGLDGEFFRVRTDGDLVYVLQHMTASDRWTLEGLRPGVGG